MSTQTDLYDAKADFASIYNQPDPRAYFATLGSFGYEIPHHGPPVFETLLDEMGGRDGKTVLDVCCSYGINAALLNHDVTLPELYDHYANVSKDIDSRSLEALDHKFYASNRRDDVVRTVGLDAADHAVHYATAVGLLDEGVAANLETDVPEAVDLEKLGSADLVTITGGIGYITGKTLTTIVEAAGDDPPWIAALSLRWIDFDPIAESLAKVDLVTERLTAYCVPQRRFASDDERQAALSGLRQRGLDASSELESDAHFAELFVARPPEAVRDVPIDSILNALVDPA